MLVGIAGGELEYSTVRVDGKEQRGGRLLNRCCNHSEIVVVITTALVVELMREFIGLFLPSQHANCLCLPAHACTYTLAHVHDRLVAACNANPSLPGCPYYPDVQPPQYPTDMTTNGALIYAAEVPDLCRNVL